MTVAAGAAEIVVMPAVHRAVQSGCVSALRGQLFRRALAVVIPAALVVSLADWVIEPRADWRVVCLLLPLPVLATLSAIFMGLLNAEGRFRQAVMSPVYGVLLSTPLLLMMPPGAVALSAVLLVFEIGRVAGLRWTMLPDRYGRGSGTSKAAAEILAWAVRGAILQMVGSLLLALNPLVDVLFARMIGAGAVSQVSYASRLWNVIPLLFSGILALLHFEWSRDASLGRLRHQTVSRNALRWGVIALSGSLAIMMLAPWLVDLIYGWGSMSMVDRQSLARLLAAYLAGSGPFVAGVIYVRAFSAVGRVQVVTISAAVGMVSNVLLDWVLIKLWGMTGIGLATSLVYLMVALMLHFSWRQYVCSESGVCREGK